MLNTKFQGYRSLEDFLSFLPYMGMVAILDESTFFRFFYPRGCI